MHRISRLDVAVLLMLLLPAATSWAQTTRPSTLPSTPDPRVLEIADKLVADDFAARQQAEDALVALGPSIVPSLQLILDQARDEEVRTRLQSALQRIDEQRLYGATLVTLHLKNMTARQAFEALSAQLPAPLEPGGDHVFQDGARRVNLECVNEPFWKVMLELTEQTGIGLLSIGEDAQLALLGKHPKPPHVISGAFLVRAESAERSVSVRYSNGNEISSNFGVSFSIWPEPKMMAAMGGGIRDIKITRAEDEKGRDMLDPQRGFVFWRSGAVPGFEVKLHPQHDDAQRLAVLSGTAFIPVNTRFETVQHDKLGEPHSQQAGDLRVSISPIKKLGDRTYQIAITVHRDIASDEVWSATNHHVLGLVRLEDAHGQPLDRGGWGSTGSHGRKIDSLLTFNRNQRGDKDVGEPARLIWRIPTESRVVEVSFEFRDLPLPR